VGQGQWATKVEKVTCLHFDFGGEFNPIHSVKKFCHDKSNALVLSHPDKDHYAFLKSIMIHLNNVCLAGPAWTPKTIRRVGARGLPFCSETIASAHWYFNPSKRKKADDNESSQISYIQNWLIPGDAPISLEKKWLSTVPNIKLISHLLLGHHGSKTSTSNELLMALPNINQCIASSREKKYGHPHRDVRIRLRKYCALIRTEDWGNLHFLD
jgi:competence protein ComEC